MEKIMTTGTSMTRRIGKAGALLVGIALSGMQLGCGLFGGSPTQTMTSGSSVPAASGTVRATEGDNGNTNIAVRVYHLAPASRVAPDATVYVVWVQPSRGRLQNVGALTLNDKLEGTLDTVTPHSRFRLTVTPEPSAMVAQPTNEPVFAANVDAKDK